MLRGSTPDASEGRHAALVRIQPAPMMVNGSVSVCRCSHHGARAGSSPATINQFARSFGMRGRPLRNPGGQSGESLAPSRP